MKVTKEGDVIFKNGEISEAANFEYKLEEGETLNDLAEYIKNHYVYVPNLIKSKRAIFNIIE